MSLMQKYLGPISAVLLVALLAACGSTPAPTKPPPAELPSAEGTAGALAGTPEDTSQPVESEAFLTDVVWQWQELIESAPAAQSSVPTPTEYTLTFRPNGTYYLQADCNSGSGTYVLEGDRLRLELGPLTMAVCPPESLHDLYLEKLGQVDAYALEDGSLALLLAGDAGRMLFGNGGPADVPAESGTAIDPASVTLDTQGLPYAYQPTLVPATPYDESQPPGPQGLPEHIQINLSAVDPQDEGSSDPAVPSGPVIYIIPVAAYRQMWESNGNSAVDYALEHLDALLESQPVPIPPFGLPALPFEEIGAGFNDLAVQGKYLDLDAGSGVRFVGRFAQDANPVTNEGLRYIYQGYSHDGQYLITFFYPVTSPTLPYPEGVPAQEQERVASDLEGYLEERVAELNALPSSGWEPPLSTLDAVIASLNFETAPGGGAALLLNTTWQWAGMLEMEATDQSPAPDPDTYSLIFRADGQLQVQADCNSGTGTYSLEGRRLTLELGAMTVAFCGEESLHDQYLALLGQVTAYKIEDGWLVLALGDGPDRMIFSNGGPVE